jgi:hypothetical protein
MSTCPECYEDVGCTCIENKRIAQLEKAICVYQREEHGHIEWEDDETAIDEFLMRWNDETCDKESEGK